MDSEKKKQLGERVKKAIGVKGDFKTAILPMMNYSFSNIAMSGSGYIVSMYFTIFLTDVVNFDLATAGVIVMIATLWDAITDPVMGVITDRTRSKYGKHRRYFLWGLPVLLVSYALMWNTFGVFDGQADKTKAMIYFTAMFMLYKTAYTIIDVPHTAMLPELAPEYNLRTQYTSMGYIFNSCGMIPAYAITLVVLAAFGSSDDLTRNSQTPFAVTGLILAVLFSVAVYFTFKLTKEPSSLDMQVPKLDLKYIINEYVYVFKNRAFRQYFFMSLAYQFATGFYLTSKVFYIKYLANQYAMYPIFNIVAGVAESAAFPLNYALTMKYGKKRCGAIVTPIMVIGLGIGLFMGRSTGGAGSIFWGVLMMLSMILYPFGMSGLGFVCNNIFPDLTDVDEVITGRRREGVISTFSTLIKKSASGIMAALVTFIMQTFGLVTGTAVQEYEAANNTLYPQTNSALWGVRICVAVIPIAATLVALVLLRHFKMSKKDHEMIRAAIATKREYGSVELTEEEIKCCEEISGQKFETTWLGKDNPVGNGNRLERNEDGEYTILVMIEERNAQNALASEK